MGFPTGISGTELGARATLQAEKFGVQMSIPSAVVKLSFKNNQSILGLESGEKTRTKTVVIAGGAAYLKLNIPNLEHFEKRGVYYAVQFVHQFLSMGDEKQAV